jgi:CheY-like chemotaxis protein
LLVDDEPDILDSVAELLSLQGYRVLLAHDGLEALERFRPAPKDIDLVLMDLTMPHMDGQEALGAMRALDPGARIVLCSGFDEAEVMKDLGLSRPTAFLQKPYSLQSLRDVIHQVLKRA